MTLVTLVDQQMLDELFPAKFGSVLCESCDLSAARSRLAWVYRSGFFAPFCHRSHSHWAPLKQRGTPLFSTHALRHREDPNPREFMFLKRPQKFTFSTTSVKKTALSVNRDLICSYSGILTRKLNLAPWCLSPEGTGLTGRGFLGPAPVGSRRGGRTP